MSNKAFTLVELLLYVAIFLVVAGLLVGVLTRVLDISNREISGGEVSSQMNLTMQTVNRLVRESSNIEIATSTATTTLKLRMKDPDKDPTYISLSGQKIILTQGASSSDLTTSKVKVDVLTFKKLTFYPGHDQVEINMQLSLNSSNPQQQASRALHTAVSRVSAATFDSGLFPGTTNLQLGSGGNVWKSINDLVYFSGNNMGIGISSPLKPLHVSNGTVSDGDVYISDAGDGIIVRSPDGSLCRRIGINNSGAVIATAVTCP